MGLVRSVDLIGRGSIVWVERTPKIRYSLSSQFQQVSNMWGCGGAKPRDDGSWERLSMGGSWVLRDGKATGRTALRALVGGAGVFVA